jgi:hypothetical protein
MRAALLLPAFLLTIAAAPAQTAPASKDQQGTTPAAATADEPAALTAMRHRFSESLIAADRAVTAQWVASLAALEKVHAAAGNYDRAEKVRLRREEALALSGTDDGRLPVKLGSRELTSKGSGLAIAEGSGTVTISSSGAFLEWDLTGDFRGWYDVRMLHAVDGRADRSAEILPFTGAPADERRAKKNGPDSSAAGYGGMVSFQNASGLSRGEVVLRREIVSTGGRNAWRTVSLGRLEVTGRIAKFRLTAEEAGSKGLMQFRQIELVPTTPPADTGEGIARLAKARETFEKEFRAQSQIATTRYREALNALEEQALRVKDTDALVRVRDEKTRLRSPEKLALGTVDETRSASVPIPLDLGSSFKVQYRGEITLDSTRTSLTKLRPAGSASITWRLPASNVGSGTYTVEIRGRVPIVGGGTATLAAFGASSMPAGAPLKIVVDPVASPGARNKKPAEGLKPPEAEDRTVEPGGSLVIGKGAEILTLTVTSLTHSDGWLMDIAGITLVRTGEATSDPDAP